MTPSKASPSGPDELEQAKKLQTSFANIRQQIGNVIVGQDRTIEQLLIAILAGGHCLLEGVPGLAKTLMVWFDRWPSRWIFSFNGSSSHQT